MNISRYILAFDLKTQVHYSKSTPTEENASEFKTGQENISDDFLDLVG